VSLVGGTNSSRQRVDNVHASLECRQIVIGKNLVRLRSSIKRGYMVEAEILLGKHLRKQNQHARRNIK
jgi:hypothetical protein